MSQSDIEVVRQLFEQGLSRFDRAKEITELKQAVNLLPANDIKETLLKEIELELEFYE